jgi:hypothetical protein
MDNLCKKEECKMDNLCKKEEKTHPKGCAFSGMDDCPPRTSEKCSSREAVNHTSFVHRTFVHLTSA